MVLKMMDLEENTSGVFLLGKSLYTEKKSSRGQTRCNQLSPSSFLPLEKFTQPKERPRYFFDSSMISGLPRPSNLQLYPQSQHHIMPS
jgi:hypothetical protein